MIKENIIPIPIYLINLDRSPERLEHFGQQVLIEGLKFIRISAVDGYTIDEDTKSKLYRQRSGLYPLGPGEMGCFLSHRKVWARILEDGLNWAFVAEDDIHFFNASQFFFNLEWLPAEADVVKAETSLQKIQLHRIKDSTPYGHELRRLQSYHGGTGGYFISKSGAEILLNLTEDKCDPIDLLMFNKNLKITQSLKIFQLDPAICIQDYLLKDTSKLVSLLDVDRMQSKREFKKIQGKPKALEKVYLELKRPILRLRSTLLVFFKTFFGNAIIKKVKFPGDARKSNRSKFFS